MLLQLLLISPPLQLKQMTIFPFPCRTLQLLDHLQEQVKMLNQDPLTPLGILPSIFQLTLIDVIMGGMLYVNTARICYTHSTTMCCQQGIVSYHPSIQSMQGCNTTITSRPSASTSDHESETMPVGDKGVLKLTPTLQSATKVMEKPVASTENKEDSQTVAQETLRVQTQQAHAVSNTTTRTASGYTKSLQL